MTSGIRFAAAVLILTAAGFAQEGLTVRAKGKQTWPAAEAQKIYRSACAVVQKGFRANPLGGTIGHVSSRRRQERGRVRPTGNQA